MPRKRGSGADATDARLAPSHEVDSAGRVSIFASTRRSPSHPGRALWRPPPALQRRCPLRHAPRSQNLTNHFKPANFEHLRRGYDCERAVPPPALPDSKRFLQSQSLPNRLSVAAPDVSHRTFQRSSQSMHVTEASWNMRQSTRPIHKTSAGPSETFCLSVSGNNTHSPKASAESGLPDEPLSPLS